MAWFDYNRVFGHLYFPKRAVKCSCMIVAHIMYYIKLFKIYNKYNKLSNKVKVNYSSKIINYIELYKLINKALNKPLNKPFFEDLCNIEKTFKLCGIEKLVK